MNLLCFFLHINNGDSMKIRLGYACLSESLNVTSSTPYTYTSFLKENDFNKLDDIIKSNLEALIEILKYNNKNNIHFFRISSSLIPLATKIDFDYIDKYKNYYDEISKLTTNMRIDFHPDQFCVLNSAKKEVIENSINTLSYHYSLLNSLKVNNKILVLHIGGNVFGKELAISRFINTYNSLNDNIKKCIAIENDDKIFDISDCLKISRICQIPIVLDYHHHLCNNNLDITNYFDEIFKTWKNINPKIHFSSPKNKTKKEFRNHNDYINSNDFINFIELIKNLPYDIDIMIEAKKKDEALFRLVRQLKYKTNYLFLDDTTFIPK